MAAVVDAATRKKVLKVVFVSLLLDLVCAHPKHRSCPAPSSPPATGLTCAYRSPSPSSCVRLPGSSTSANNANRESTALFPKLIEFYRNLEAPTSFSSQSQSPTVLAHILQYLNAYKASFARPIDSRYDIVLLGGALGSIFS